VNQEERELFDLAVFAIRHLKHGDCWCEMGIDNPMYRDHSEGCKAVRRFMNTIDNKVKR
jgi:hypothetical protein